MTNGSNSSTEGVVGIDDRFGRRAVAAVELRQVVKDLFNCPAEPELPNSALAQIPASISDRDEVPSRIRRRYQVVFAES